MRPKTRMAYVKVQGYIFGFVLGLMMVTQWKRCHENDETASVRRVRCSVRRRVVNEASFETGSGLDRDRGSSHDAEAKAWTSACVQSQYTVHSAQMLKKSLLLGSESAFIMTGRQQPLLTSNKKQWSSHPLNDADLVDLHTLVAEHGDVGHGTVKSDSLMEQGVVGRDKSSTRWSDSKAGSTAGLALRVARGPGTRAAPREPPREGPRDAGTSERVWWRHRHWHGIESYLPKLEFDQDFAESRRVLRRESLRESLRAWLWVQVCLRESLQGSVRVWIRVCIQVCLLAERERCVRALVNHLLVDNRDCERMHV